MPQAGDWTSAPINCSPFPDRSHEQHARSRHEARDEPHRAARRRGRGGADVARRRCSRTSDTRSRRSPSPSQEAAELIVREDPDLTIVVVHQDDDHALALIAEAVETASGPVIAQLRGRDDVDFVARAAERGISAYVESNDPQVVQASIEVTIRRYREAARLNEKVEPARDGARAPRRDRARQGHPHGAPRHRRQARRSAACATTPAPATAASSTSRRPSSTATRCCPPRGDARTSPRARPGTHPA